jgi:pyruvate kinase
MQVKQLERCQAAAKETESRTGEASTESIGGPTRARRTRIVATIGPASSGAAMLDALLAAGMDAARVNFSHGDPLEQADLVRRLRALGRRNGRPLSVIADLPGPKLRIGELGGTVTVRAGATVAIGTGTELPLTDPALLRHVRTGDRVLIDDGAVALTVLWAGDGQASLRAHNPGTICSHKGVNLPDTPLPTPALTERDRELLKIALEAGADHIALSFVRNADDIADLRAALAEEGSRARIIAKIEMKAALAAIEEIVAAADAVMVARGDLGVEIPPAEVPLWQKAIIAAARRTGRPVITATQMLQSMVDNERPTRAEASDVANAIIDSTDAVMLSAETAVGSYPVQAVRTMAEIALQAEGGLPGQLSCEIAPTESLGPHNGVETREAAVTASISSGACDVANRLDAAAIVTSTMSGRTARAVARLRPVQPVVALSVDELVRDQLALCWGVTPLPCAGAESFEDVVREADEILVANGLCRRGDLVVITAGIQGYTPGTTNLIKAHVVR